MTKRSKKTPNGKLPPLLLRPLLIMNMITVKEGSPGLKQLSYKQEVNTEVAASDGQQKVYSNSRRANASVKVPRN